MIFGYGILKITPLCFQEIIYDYGRYNKVENETEIIYSEQKVINMYESTGIRAPFMNSYNVLLSLPYITDIINEDTNTFLMLANSTTHEPMLLQEPDYVPSMTVNNTKYEYGYQEKIALNGQIMKHGNRATNNALSGKYGSDDSIRKMV